MLCTLRIAILCVLVSSARAQSTCPPLQAPVLDPSVLLFTPQQEEELGDIIRQQLESRFLVIEEDQVTDYLREIGDRVARHLPETGLHYEFLLYDQPEIQAFSMPGGRIYVSRKMVAFLRNDDELAGLLGHELGHLAARQQALDISREFREVLGVKSLSSDDDLYDLYNQLLESYGLKKRRARSREREEKGQKIADQLGVQAVGRAGYAPQAFPDLLDRIMETKGKTGSWLSDLFGTTRPDSKRLREALKDVGHLPAACIEAKAARRSDEFQQWQTAVLHYKGIGHAEHLPGVLTRKPLNNPLRADIEEFRFSPDGKYLLAQDEGGIYVLTRDPFKFVLRIDTSGALSPQFSPDSRQVVFFSSGVRVETWEVERLEQTSVTDVPALHGCRQAALSPDARYLACFGNNLDLTLFEVGSGEAILKKEHFFDLEGGLSAFAGFFKFLYLLTHHDAVTLRFSPDGHYFAASSRTKEEVAVDLTTQREIKISGPLHTAMEYSFTFVGPDKIIGVDASNLAKSPLAEFPSGKVIDRLPLGGENIIAATNPKYLAIRPLKDYPVGIYDFAQRKMVARNRKSAADIWGEVAASELLDGQIGLYKANEETTNNLLQLPLGKLGPLRTFTASPDLRWMAMSTRTRGGVWDVEKNERVFHLRGFQDAYYAPNSVFFMDFPEFEKTEREMGVLSPVTGQSKGRTIEKDDDLTFFGDVFLRTKHNEKNRNVRRNFAIEALDMATQKSLWSRSYPKQGPRVHGSVRSGKVVLLWNTNSDGLRDELARDPKLQARWSKEKPDDTDYFLEVVGARDGTTAGGIVVHTGKYSFLPERMEAAGDWAVVTDNRNRVLLYSVSTGELKAKWFGYLPEISRHGDRLCISNGRGHVAIYDLHTLKQTTELYFASRVSLALFSDDGERLLVLTEDQTVLLIDATKESRAASAVTH